MKVKRSVVFIPVSDMASYRDYDDAVGYGGTNQLDFQDGILVKKEDEDMFRGHIKNFEED